MMNFSKYVPFDPVSKTLASIDLAHYKVHEGEHYTVSDHDADVDIAGPKYWHIITPGSNIKLHAKIALLSDQAGLVEFFENPTVTNNGTILPSYNNDRNSIRATSGTFYYDPTVSSDGTRIDTSWIGAYNQKTRVGGDTRRQAELILKQNESYLLKFTPEADDAKVTMLTEYYEAES